MIFLDQALAVFEDEIFTINDTIRWQPTLALPRLIDPREAWMRMPISAAARISSSKLASLGKRYK